MRDSGRLLSAKPTNSMGREHSSKETTDPIVLVGPIGLKSRLPSVIPPEKDVPYSANSCFLAKEALLV